VPNTQGLLLALASNLGGNDRNLTPAIDALAKVKTHSLYSSAADLMTKVQSGEVWASYTSQGRAISLMQAVLRCVFPFRPIPMERSATASSECGRR
jgi:spermidine/putrescine-binding protein